MVYVDSSRSALVDGFIRKTFMAMIEGAHKAAIESALVEPSDFDAGVRALRRSTETNGVFCYTFFKGIARKRELPPSTFVTLESASAG